MGLIRAQEAGPCWDVLLMPESLGRLVMGALAGRPSRTAALGWVFAHAGQWGVFLPAGSDAPAWPLCTTYLKTGWNVALPPDEARPETWTEVSGWVRRDGPQLSKPLLLHPIVTLLAAEMPNCPSPEF
ncbi:hypothetical protein AB0N77_21190 [Streptomyces misionensis]|uniref:hypothetical protein n=1 Tax=Streptomyces misionensis TaxID=67331 RepID=UPI003421B71D